nr:MAG TPA: hypothetical protein [Bacteriophage sp.]
MICVNFVMVKRRQLKMDIHTAMRILDIFTKI